jgi:hypothetical protein
LSFFFYFSPTTKGYLLGLPRPSLFTM